MKKIPFLSSWLFFTALILGIYLLATCQSKVQSSNGNSKDKQSPVPQSNLTWLIFKASNLTFDSIAPPPQRCWVGHQPYLVPNSNSESWDMIMPYYSGYGGNGEAIIHDFGTGETSRQVWGEKEENSITAYGTDFNMQPSFYTNGKLVFYVWSRDPDLSGLAVTFLVYDPELNKFIYITVPNPPGKYDNIAGAALDMNREGIIYGIGFDGGKDGYLPVSFNIKTMKAKTYDKIGPYHGNLTHLYRECEAVGDWVYAAIGNKPWRLVAYNFKTKEGKILAESTNIKGDWETIDMNKVESAGKRGISGYIRQAGWIEGIGDRNIDEYKFWLYDGEIYERKNKIAPWSGEGVTEIGTPGFRWDREFQYWPENFEPKGQLPVFEKGASSPNAYGEVSLPYHFIGESKQRTLEYKVKMYDGMVRRILEINEQTLVATDEGYGQTVFYDLNSGNNKRVNGKLSPYSMALNQSKQKLYISGYPNSQMYIYDLTRDVGHDLTPPNPQFAGYIGKHSDTHAPFGTEVGADGRIYNAGTTYGRQRTGGGFGWYDPKKGDLDGLWKPFSAYRVFWTASAYQGRYIFLSTKPTNDELNNDSVPEVGKLFCWDTQTHEFIYTIKPPGRQTPGPITEAYPGLMIGYTKTENGEKGRLYGFKAETGKILWTKEVPEPPITSFSRVRRHAYSFRPGPDDHIWAFMGSTLVRIDPRNIEVKVVGKANPAQLGFAMGNVYIAGGSWLRQIKGIHTKDEIAPLKPKNLHGSAKKEKIELTWDRNMDRDLEGYHIYRTLDTLTEYTRINDSLLDEPAYIDTHIAEDTLYYYKVTAVDDADNESDYSDRYSVTSLISGINPGKLDHKLNVKIYPNPTEGMVNVELNCLKSGWLKIFNQSGRIIKEHQISGPLEKVNISGNPPGVYFYKLMICGATIVKRIILY